jgi:glyoxylase-like metal-dependent hydrolase (beta-lactamase superfamily II)
MPTPRHDSLPDPLADPLAGLTVLQRGWLSSNNVLIHPAPGEAGAVLVDASHVNHADQTCELVRHALRGEPLVRLVNTHLHSDHCGGNAALKAAFGMPISLAPGMLPVVRAWDQQRLTHDRTGQRCVRFLADDELSVTEPLHAGGRLWEVILAPGHDPDSVVLFDRAHGVLISADALWENGFGVVFPELEGEPGFDDVGAVLDQIASLPVRVVIPGHGAPFTDVAEALQRARRRLAGFRADPQRHAQYAMKVLIKYHLMEERRQPLEDLLDWAVATPYLHALWERHGRAAGSVAALGPGCSPRLWAASFVQDLVRSGALALEGAWVVDAGAA